LRRLDARRPFHSVTPTWPLSRPAGTPRC
jgi:hypothetical protein